MQHRSLGFTIPLVMVGLLAARSPALAAATCRPASPAAKEAAWKAYRDRFPFLMQGVAHMQGDTGCTLIVIAEPPPDVRIPDLLAEIDAAEQPDEVFVGQNRFGGDGWTKDLVVTVDDGPDHAANAISLLHHHLYGTSFRAWTTDLDAPPSARDGEPLNFAVTAGDLDAWMFDAATAFEPLLGGPAQTAKQLLRQASPGVYEAANPPLVAWVLALPVDLTERGPEARQFTMSSDLVLGSLISASHVVIVGRARRIPCEVLPPLRTETIALLASARTALGQSYERNSPLAGPSGPLSSHLTAWAPIFLSPTLIDTEYGSLLNLTDQLLKSFSNAGRTQYTGFAYPLPDHFPFANQTVYDHLGLSSITYNWNTENFASFFDRDHRYLIMAFRGTGALPLDYLPGSSPTAASQQASEVGRAYFAALGDPNLARVVQYASLYHIFVTANQVGAHDGAAARAARGHSPAEDRRLSVIEAAARTMLNAYAHAPASRLREVGTREFDAVAPASWPRIPAARAQWAGNVVKDRDRSPFARATDAQLAAIAKLWTDPPSSPTAEQQRMLDACEQARAYMQALIDIDRVRAEYLATLPGPGAPWLHTSTWVTSTNDSVTEGGHNIDFRPRQITQLPTARRWQAALGQARPGPIERSRTIGWHTERAPAARQVLDGYRGTSQVHVVRLERTTDHYRLSFADRDHVFHAWTQADAVDTIAQVTRSHDGAEPLRIHCETCTAAEVRNLRAQLDRMINKDRTTPRPIEALAFERGITPEHAQRYGASLPLGQLALRAVEIDQRSLMLQLVDLRHNQPGRLQRLYTRIKLAFSTRVTEPLRAKVNALGNAVKARLGARGSVLDLATALHSELNAKLAAEGVTVDVQILEEAGDVHVVERAVLERWSRG